MIARLGATTAVRVPDMAATDVPTLLSIPLELRHNIFEKLAETRATAPKKVLRHWFEKKEAAEKTEALASKDPNGPTPQVIYNNDYEPDSEPDSEPDVDIQEDEGSESDEDAGTQGDEDDQDEETELEEEAEQLEDVANEDNEGDLAEEDVDVGDETNADGIDGESQTEEDDMPVDDGTRVVAAQLARPAPIIRPHPKWRHIPKFLRITHNPPPMEVLRVSKQLTEEAMQWYYNIAILRIDATGSFAHTSMFEESLNQITDAAFSPMENIRKVEIKYVWDSLWLRAEDGGSKIEFFVGMLHLRTECIVSILKRAPQLQDVVIHWHDSIEDGESTYLKLSIVDCFDSLIANLKVEERYLHGEEPHAKSIAGQRRLEFERIRDDGWPLN